MILESVTDNPTDFVFKNNGKGRVWLTSRNSAAGYSFIIYTNPTEATTPTKTAFSIKQDGKVGIWTTNPQVPLDVNGKIRCEEIEVIADVPSSDFVFEPDYELMTLGALENYIKENKHLPEIPSAQEFKENGYSVGEMDDLLLRKIEELTLYIIEQEKRIKELEKTK
jgi:hypothetical protein